MHSQRRLRELQEGLLLEQPTQTVAPLACAERLALLTKRPASGRRCNTGFYASHQSEMLMCVAWLSVSLHWNTIRTVSARHALGKTSELECAAQHKPACQLRARPVQVMRGWKKSASLALIHGAMRHGMCSGLSLMNWLKTGYDWAALWCGSP